MLIVQLIIPLIQVNTGDGLLSIVAIVIGATAGTILLSVCAICAIGLLCVKRCCRSRNIGTRFVTTKINQYYLLATIIEQVWSKYPHFNQ